MHSATRTNPRVILYANFATILLSLFFCAAQAQSPRGLEVTQRINESFEEGKRYAVIIGINNYKSEDIQDLKYAVRDAEKLFEVLTDPRLQSARFAPESVELLTDGSAMPPTRVNIGNSLARVATLARENDLVLIFFSGHGFEEGGRAYLAPQDADLTTLDFSCIDRDGFVRTIDKMAAKKVVVILDACHAGGISRGGKGDDVLSNQYYENFAGSAGRAFIASCLGGQNSWEDEESGHGAFTRSLVDGFSGEADLPPKDGIVTLYELQQFVEEDVSDWARKKGKSQQPQVNLESAYGKWPISLNADYLDQEVARLNALGQEAVALKDGLLAKGELKSDELAEPFALLDSLAADKELDKDEEQMVQVIRSYVNGTININVYRSSIRGLTITVVNGGVKSPPLPRYWYSTAGISGFLYGGDEFAGGVSIAPLARVGYCLGRWSLEVGYMFVSGELEDPTYLPEFDVNLLTFGPRVDVPLSQRFLAYFRLGVGGYLSSAIRGDQPNVALDVGTGIEVAVSELFSVDLILSWIFSTAELIPPDKPALDQGLCFGIGLTFTGARRAKAGAEQ